MMEAYRAEGDVIAITKRLLDRDVFETVEMAARARARGWAPRACAGCRRPLAPALLEKQQQQQQQQFGAAAADEEEDGFGKFTIMRIGIAYHGSCYRNVQ